MNRRALLLLAGFALAGSGLYALIVSLVGLNVSYLVWAGPAGSLFGFLVRVLLIMAGAVVIVLGTTNWDRERRLIDAYLAQRRLSGVDPQKN